ncbi:hypothetical protein ACM714_27540 [Pseudomonas aeruginosa]|nr:hypothetical protein [Pseudomonas aeruginosa]HCL3292889.1 hypothetical protein [Pseudomonas aeruginosa]
MYANRDTHDKRGAAPKKTVKVLDQSNTTTTSSSPGWSLLRNDQNSCFGSAASTSPLYQASGLGSSTSMSMMGSLFGKVAKVAGGAAAGYVIDQISKKDNTNKGEAPAVQPVAGPSGLQSGDAILGNKTKKWEPRPDSNIVYDAAKEQVEKRVTLAKKTASVITDPEQSAKNFRSIGEHTKELAKAIYGANRIATGEVSVSPGDVATVSKGVATDAAHNAKNMMVGAVKGGYAAATVSQEGVQNAAKALDQHVKHEAQEAAVGIALAQGVATAVGALPHPAAKAAAVAIRAIGSAAAGANFSEKTRKATENLHGSATGEAVNEILQNAAESRATATTPSTTRITSLFGKGYYDRQRVIKQFSEACVRPGERLKVSVLEKYMKDTEKRLAEMEGQLDKAKGPAEVVTSVAGQMVDIGCASHSTHVQENMPTIHTLYKDIAEGTEKQSDRHLKRMGRISRGGQDETREAYQELRDIDRVVNAKPPTHEQLEAARRRFMQNWELQKEQDKAKREAAQANAFAAALNIINTPAFSPEKQAAYAQREREIRLEEEQREQRARAEWTARRDQDDADVASRRAAECARTERLRERERALEQRREQLAERARSAQPVVAASAPVDALAHASAPVLPAAVPVLEQPAAEQVPSAPPPYSEEEQVAVPSAPEAPAEQVGAPPTYAQANGEAEEAGAMAAETSLPAYTEQPSLGETVLEYARLPDCDASALAEMNDQYEQLLADADRQLAEQMAILDSGSVSDLPAAEAVSAQVLPELPSVEGLPDLPLHEEESEEVTESPGRSRRRARLLAD